MTEAEMVDRCRRGDREAQRVLYERTAQPIYRLLLRMTGNADTAFDLAQDTYLRAFARIGQFDGRAALATWLYRIAVTEALQFLRRRRRERAQPAANEPDVPTEASDHRVAVRLDVHDALAALDPIDRTVLLLRYQEGLDYRSIAAVVECAEGTVASRLHRARERMRHLLEAGYGPAEETGGAGHQTEGVLGVPGATSTAGGPGTGSVGRD